MPVRRLRFRLQRHRSRLKKRQPPQDPTPTEPARTPTSPVISTEPPCSTGASRTDNDSTSPRSSRERRDPVGAAPTSQRHPSRSERQRSHLPYLSFSGGISPLATILRRPSDPYGRRRSGPPWDLGRDDGVGARESTLQGLHYSSSKPCPHCSASAGSFNT